MQSESREHNKKKGKDGGQAKLKQTTTFCPHSTSLLDHFSSPHPTSRTPVLSELVLTPQSLCCPALVAIPRPQSLMMPLAASYHFLLAYECTDTYVCKWNQDIWPMWETWLMRALEGYSVRGENWEQECLRLDSILARSPAPTIPLAAATSMLFLPICVSYSLCKIP